MQISRRKPLGGFSFVKFALRAAVERFPRRRSLLRVFQARITFAYFSGGRSLTGAQNIIEGYLDRRYLDVQNS